MDVTTKKIEILTYRPDLVTIKDLGQGKTIKVNTRLFDKQINIGFYDVTNPEALPKVF